MAISISTSNHAIWEEIERSESYLVSCMYEEATSIASSVLRDLCHNKFIKAGEETQLNDMLESASMVLVQSLKELRRTQDILNELLLLFGSVTEIPVQVLLAGVCFQISEGPCSGTQEFLEEFLSKWRFLDERYYVLASLESNMGYMEGSGGSFGSFLLGVDKYLEVVEVYVVTLLGMVVRDIDHAICWVEKATLPEEKRQLLRGLKYLHSANILHRDLKPGNLLINANCDLKICDFGLARTSSGNDQFMTEYVVTRWYRAPELLLCCDNYGTSIDVWSVGCIFAELLGRKPVFPGTECLNQLKLIINILGSQREDDIEFIDNAKARKYIKSLPYSPGTPFSCLYPNAHPLAIDLLQKMLVFDPTKRIGVTEALQHPYMSSLYDQSSDPPAQVPIDLDIDEDLREEMIREMMWNEMLHHHPEAAPATVEVNQ